MTPEPKEEGAWFASAPQAVVIADEDGRITTMNPRAELLFERSKDDAVGRPVTSLIREGLDLHRTEYDATGIRPGGKELAVEVSVGALAAGEAGSVVAIVRDCTERRRELDGLRANLTELRRLNEERARFAHVASHDLSEPLRTMTGFAEALMRRHGDTLDPEAREFVERIIVASQRMRGLIDSLYAFASVGTAATERSEVDSGALVAGLLEELAAAITESHAEITVGDLPWVSADQWQLRLVFQNLISNAIKFVRDVEPQIAITATRSNGTAEFSVRDNGIGVNPRWSKDIFTPFYRLHSRDEFAGTGIGLAICARVVEGHGGRIWAEPAEGGGTVFRFTIPDEESSA